MSSEPDEPTAVSSSSVPASPCPPATSECFHSPRAEENKRKPSATFARRVRSAFPFPLLHSPDRHSVIKSVQPGVQRLGGRLFSRARLRYWTVSWSASLSLQQGLSAPLRASLRSVGNLCPNWKEITTNRTEDDMNDKKQNEAR